MRLSTATIIPIALTSLLAACDPGPRSIGSLDGETGEIDECSPPGVDLEFEVIGLGDDFLQDVTLTCAATVSSIANGYAVALSDCSDPNNMPHADLELRLTGDWSEPLVDGEPQIELHYIRDKASVTIEQQIYYDTDSRWLSLRNPGGQVPLPLVAVDANWTYPSAILDDYEFDYGPLAIDSDSLDCPVIEEFACAPIERGALIVSIDDQPFAVAEGTESTAVVGSDGYRVFVEQTRGLVDDCVGSPPAAYEFGIVAVPNS